MSELNPNNEQLGSESDDDRIATVMAERPADDARDHKPDHDEMIHEEDPGAKALTDALNICFLILKFIMIALVLGYLITGLFRVDPQNKAVKLTFGAIVGEPGQQVLEQGWYWNWPYPIGEHVSVSQSPRTISLNREFWYSLRPGEEGKKVSELQARPLNPMMDGSVITGDANIVHGRFDVTYKIQDFVNFIENVGTVEKVTLGDTEMARADEIVRQAVATGVVHAIAKINADEYIAGRTNMESAMRRAQRMLDDLETGIVLETLTATQHEMPNSVRAAYEAVSNAENERGQLIQRAQQVRAKILGETAGEAHVYLYKLVRDYQLALSADDAAKTKAFEEMIDQALRTLRVKLPESDVEVRIGGETAAVIKQAESYKTQVVEQIKGEVNTFKILHDEYKANPVIFKNRYRQAAREKIFTSEDVETNYVLGGKLYLETNRDPEIQRKREENRLRKQQEDLVREGMSRQR
ncbi:SPFH domain-containing protein [Poriferisphaera sp. WC338]|uniref:SPFH domain-containing protein n=1 Tax=Poriferisphaera sp. WC338 TaxID=3425129 RepID=UPI003D8134AB